MIACVQCGFSSPVGAVFCLECGANLVGQVPIPEPFAPASGAETPGQGASAPPWAVLELEDGSHAFALARRDEFILGRADDSRASKPDIDLSPFGAFASGVSRRHAAVRHQSGRILLADLDSANGTYVNGKRLHPKHEASLSDRDVISLGALKLQVRLRTTN